METLVEMPDQKSSRIVVELEAKGYKLISRSRSQLTFRGKDNSIVAVNLKTGSISLDIK
jgi:hypothetical protein